VANYSNIAVQTTLAAPIGASDLTLAVADPSGYPTAPFRIVLDPGSVVAEEVCEVTHVAGTVFTVTRGFDGTTATGHAGGAHIIHAVVASDLTDLQAADSAEAAARAAADTTLQTTITSEASTRAAADLLRLLITNNLSDLASPATARANLGLGNVENTALSTWAGSSALTTLGTIVSGIWHGTPIGLAYGGTNADLSATSGYLKQASAGAAVVPVSTIPYTDLSYAGLVAGQVLKASGAAAASFSALTLADLPASVISGAGAAGQLAYFTGAAAIANAARLAWDDSANTLTLTSDTTPALTIQPITATADATMRLKAGGAIGGAGGHAVFDFYDNATRGFRFIGAFGNSAGSRYGGFIAGQDRDGNDIPLRFFTNDASHNPLDSLFLGAGAAQGKVVLRSTTTSVAAGLYVPWKSGDTLPTLVAGVLTAGNNQIAISGISESEAGLQGSSSSGPGVRALSVTGNPFLGRLTDTGTVNIPVLSILQHRSSGTPAPGFGGSLKMQLQSSTTIDQDAFEVKGSWISATHASRKARFLISVYDTAEREVLRADADGARANIGLLGASDFAGGSGVLGILDRTTAPTTTPAGGHVYFSASGLPSWRTGAGNTIALAGSGTLTIPTSGTAAIIARTAVNNADYTVLATDRYVAQTGTMSAPRTFTLPAASAVTAGTELVIKDESGTVGATNTLTIARAGSDTLDGATSLVLMSASTWLRLISDGVSKWFVSAIKGGLIAEYTASGSLPLPIGVSIIRLLPLGAGGGAGAGRRGAAGSARFGGGGGAAGSLGDVTYSVAELSALAASLTITIGSGGSGGAAQSADDTDGASGTAGGNTTVAAGATTVATGTGGPLGSGGTNATGAAGAAGAATGTTTTWAGGAGGASSTSATAANGGASKAAGGGAGGGGIDSSNVARAGGNSGAGSRDIPGPSASQAGGAATGVNGTTAITATRGTSGGGGSGGGANTSGAGGTGGNGTRGGGGGGGGASANGSNSGAGGNGGDGYLRIYIW
jgi:hypothetical protein